MQDGNIHCHIDNLSRRDGNGGTRVAVASAAYVSGQRLWSEVEQRLVDFGMREDVVFSELILPGGTPEWTRDRAGLWNRVDLSARRKDARLAKTVVAAIAREIPEATRVALLRAFAGHFVALGCVADVAIHEDGTGHNPHLHLLLTTRRLTRDGFGDKLTALEQRQFVKQVRQQWSELTNRFLAQAGSSLRVDHRSYKARGIEIEPTVHRGPDQRERRDKREHARRVRKEQGMSRPDAYEKSQYPHLAARETWPPEPEASPEMTRPERDEHHRYWEDRKIDRLEEHYRTPSDKPWYQQALERAQAGTGRDAPSPAERPQAVVQRQEEAQASYERTVLERAREMPRTQAEQAALDAARGASPETARFVEDFILQERMQAVRDRDRAGRLRTLPGPLRDRLEALRSEDRERNLPVPGPHRELLSPVELDRAQERMLVDYHRGERERER